LDLKKAVSQSLFPEVQLTPRTYFIPRTLTEAIAALELLRYEKKKVAYDIEGWWNKLQCIGFANDIHKAIIIPVLRRDGSRYWLPHDEIKILQSVARLLEDASVPKVAQNGLYDRFCLHYGMGIRVHGTTDDTMVKHWALYSELAKDVNKKKGKKGMGLAIQASLYTDMPYYKAEREAESDDEFYQYCGKDCVITLEVDQKIEKILSYTGPGQSFLPEELETMKRQYRFNIEVTNALLYMEIRGILYGEKQASDRRATLKNRQD
jgi:DNA polymerase I-like protein with 3'-5' exonuclease and polymerase domains